MFFIAEAGVNHNGDIELAKKLIDVAADCGADAVKFQTFKAEETVKANARTVAYQARTTAESDQFQLLKKLELTESAHYDLIAHAKASQIEFMSTAFDKGSADFLVKCGVSRLKIPSGEVTNLPFLRHLASFDLPLIMSTGMATLAEVHDAVATIRSIREKHGFRSPLADKLTILHCTSAYPTPGAELNLRAISTLSETFSCPIGYSDHAEDDFAALIALTLGATVYEKHYTVDRTLPGPDHAASLEPDELKRMIAQIRLAEKALGDGIKAPQPSEMEALKLVRRGLYAKKDLMPGTALQESDIAILRPESELKPKQFDRLLGQVLSRKLAAGDPFLSTDLD